MTEKQINHLTVGHATMRRTDDDGIIRPSARILVHAVDGMADGWSAKLMAIENLDKWSFTVSLPDGRTLGPEDEFDSNLEALEGLKVWLITQPCKPKREKSDSAIKTHRTDGVRIYICLTINGRRYKLAWLNEKKDGASLGLVKFPKRHCSYHRDGARHVTNVPFGKVPDFDTIDDIAEAHPIGTLAFSTGNAQQLGVLMTENEPGLIIDLGDANNLPESVNFGAYISHRTQVQRLEKMIWNFTHAVPIVVRSFPLHYFSEHAAVVFVLSVGNIDASTVTSL